VYWQALDLERNSVIAEYKIVGEFIQIRSPFCQTMVDDCRKWAGKFSDGIWTLPISRLPEVQRNLGDQLPEHQKGLVKVEIAACNIPDAGQLTVGWFVLASRRTKHEAAKIYAQLVRGEIPVNGGSTKHPTVSASIDAVFVLFVPPDFADRYGLKIVNTPQFLSDPRVDAIKSIKALMTTHAIQISELVS
jgi:hypothetical protein